MFLPFLYKVIDFLLPVDEGGVDDLPVEEAGASGGRGKEPHQEEYLALIVEGEPEAEEQVGHLFCQCDECKHYPVGHPVYILLGMKNAAQ